MTTSLTWAAAAGGGGDENDSRWVFFGAWSRCVFGETDCHIANLAAQCDNNRWAVHYRVLIVSITDLRASRGNWSSSIQAAATRTGCLQCVPLDDSMSEYQSMNQVVMNQIIAVYIFRLPCWLAGRVGWRIGQRLDCRIIDSTTEGRK